VFPKLKADSKTSFGATHFFFLPKLWNLELHNLYLVFVVPSPSLMLLLVMVVVVPVVTVVQE